MTTMIYSRGTVELIFLPANKTFEEEVITSFQDNERPLGPSLIPISKANLQKRHSNPYPNSYPLRQRPARLPQIPPTPPNNGLLH